MATDSQLPTEIVATLKSHKKAITEAWRRGVSRGWGDDDSRVRTFLAELEAQRDLLSLLIGEAEPGSESQRSAMGGVLDRLRRPDYTVEDFLHEAFLLEEAIAAALRSAAGKTCDTLLADLLQIRGHLGQLTGRLVAETAVIYEHVVKHGGRAFCQVDDRGLIIYANPEMLRLAGEGALTGKALATLFEEGERPQINAAIADRDDRSPALRVLHLTTADGRRLTAGVELAPLVIAGRYRGGYASLVDISGPMAGQMKLMEHSPLGIVRVNTGREIIYANPKACEISGVADMKGRSINELFPDPANREIVEEHLKKRFGAGEASEYEVELTRLDRHRKKVPVMIAATPEWDPGGTVIGSMAILRSLELEKATERINDHIAVCLDSTELLAKVAGEIASLCPFDMISVSLYSKDLGHIRSLYTAPQLPTRFRWWRMPASAGRWANSRAFDAIDDLDAFLSQPDWQELKNNREIEELLRQGLFSMTRCPVWEGRLVAAVTLFRKGKGAFRPEERKLLKALPLSKAVLTALHLDEKHKLVFRFNLLKKIFAVCDDMKRVAEAVTSELVRHYGWDNVSIFRVDEKRERFCLLSQTAKGDNEAYLLPPDYTQSFQQGVLGYVYRTCEPIFTGNVTEDPRTKDYYLPGYRARSNSELCMPIMANGKPFWLLNIEDPRENAFSSDEMEELQTIHAEIGGILERAFLYHYLEATMRHASDAIIVTDSRGRIQRTNPAVEKLLGFQGAELRDQSLEKIFVDQGAFRWLASGGQIPGQEVELRHRDGEAIPVHLSTSQLPEEMGGTVLIAKDLSALKRLEELDYLGKMYYEIAVQTKTPLSLLFSWLKRLQTRLPAGPDLDTIDKSLKQLRKLTLTYDRLALYDKRRGLVPYREILLDIAEVLDRLPEEFPEAEWQKVDIEKEPETPLLRGDIFQLTFCIETILSYLLRAAPEEGRVRIGVAHGAAQLRISLCGVLPEPVGGTGATGETLATMAETLTDMALGDKVIRAFVANHGGRYETRRDGDQCEFRIELPIAGERGTP